MTNREAIETIKIAIAEVEWNYPMEYSVAFDKAIEALERQIPKKPKVISDYGICCNTEECGFIFAFTENTLKVMGDLVQYDYCPCCGQKIDWSDYK